MCYCAQPKYNKQQWPLCVVKQYGSIKCFINVMVLSFIDNTKHSYKLKRHYQGETTVALSYVVSEAKKHA